MNFEVRILNEIKSVKEQLQLVSDFYQEDFLLDNIVFITVDDESKLDPVLEHIQFNEEQYAYQF